MPRTFCDYHRNIFAEQWPGRNQIYLVEKSARAVSRRRARCPRRWRCRRRWRKGDVPRPRVMWDQAHHSRQKSRITLRLSTTTRCKFQPLSFGAQQLSAPATTPNVPFVSGSVRTGVMAGAVLVVHTVNQRRPRALLTVQKFTNVI